MYQSTYNMLLVFLSIYTQYIQTPMKCVVCGGYRRRLGFKMKHCCYCTYKYAKKGLYANMRYLSIHLTMLLWISHYIILCYIYIHI